MSRVRVEDLSNEQLNEWVARAQGWEIVTLGWGTLTEVWLDDTEEDYRHVCERSEYKPSSTFAQWAELIDNYSDLVKQELQIIEDNGNYGVYLSRVGNSSYSDYIWGYSVSIAICRAVIASAFGEYVEVTDVRQC